jgi:hypothetical protein
MPTDSTQHAGQLTKYVVLQADDSGYWIELSRYAARTPEAAIKAAYNSRDGEKEPTRFVAIPARSFQPVTLQVETQTVIKLQPATSQDT